MRNSRTNRPKLALCLPAWMGIGHPFWRTYFPIYLVILAFFTEAPGLIVMDWNGVKWTIHANDTLRVDLAKFFGCTSISRNLLGWARDLDKIVPYAAAAFITCAFRGTLRKTIGRQINPTEATVFPAITGLLGAAFIFYHYWIAPGSNHMHNWEAKGLYDAVKTLVVGKWSLDYLGLFLYRISYFFLAPVAWFLLFYSIGGLILVSKHIAESLSKDQRVRLVQLRLIAQGALWAALGPAIIVGFHTLVPWLYGLSHFKIERGRWLLIPILMVFPLIGLWWVGVALRSHAKLSQYWPLYRKVIPTLAKDFSSQVSKWTHLLVRFFEVGVLLVSPYAFHWVPITKSSENQALSVAKSAFLDDWHNSLQGAVQWDNLINRLYDDTGIRNFLGEQWSSYSAESHPLILTIAALRRIGISDDSIIECSKRQDPAKAIQEKISQARSNIFSRFPLFNSGGTDGTKALDTLLSDLATVWGVGWRLVNIQDAEKRSQLAQQILTGVENGSQPVTPVEGKK